MARHCLLFVVCTLWLSVAPSFAAEVSQLYEVEVVVQDRSTKERTKGIALALRQVLVKVTGDRDVPNRLEIRKASKTPQRFVQQFRYGAREQEAADPLITLWVSFDHDAVNRLLRDVGVPIWGRARPVLLVWLAVEEGPVRYLLGADNNPQLSSLVHDEAARRGIPLTLPLLDLEDRNAVDFTAVWGGFHEAITPASERYQAEVILVGRLYQDGKEGFGARWSLLQQGQVLNWSSSGYLTAEVIADGIDNAVDNMANYYAPKIAIGQQKELLLYVDGIRDLGSYARVSAYLNSLSPVEQSAISQVKPGAAIYALKLRTDIPNLQQVIQLGNTLAKNESLDPVTGEARGGVRNLSSRLTLFYRLLP